METRANYVLIGAFTLAGILGALGFFLWLAKVEVDRQYAYYDVLFEDVSGLSQASDVRYNGLLVGQVVQLSLYEPDPSKIRVRVEVSRDTPVKTDTYATLEYQGVTGVTYVSLTGGSPEAAPLQPASGQQVAVIRAERSAVQSLFQATPELLTKAIVLIEDLSALVGDENRQAFDNMIGNLESASGRLDTALGDFSALSGQLAEASAAIARFTETLDTVADGATTTLSTADETLRTASAAIEESRATIDEATAALGSARRTFDSANELIAMRLPGVLDRVESTAGAIETTVAKLGGKAGGVADKLDRVAGLAADRLAQAEATLARLDVAIDTATATLSRVDQTAQSVDTLVKGDGAALVAEARLAVASATEAIGTANRVIERDLPAIVEDVRGATATVNATVTRLGEDLSGVSGRLDGLAADAQLAITAATDTFRNANGTLAALTRTMETADGTLTAAEGTFARVNRLVDEDMGAIITDVRSAVSGLEAALAEVSGDLPVITGEVRSTLERTSRFVENLDRLVLGNSDQIEAFMQAGMPQFVRFVEEASRLVINMQRLTARIEKDPARFLLGTQAPEFRR